MDGQFRFPEGVAVDTTTGNIYVADTFNHRIQVLDSQGNFLRKFGSLGSGDGQFDMAESVAVDPNTGNIVVKDSGIDPADPARTFHRIQVFDSQGNLILKFGRFGSDAGRLILPQGVAVDASSNINVADSGNHRVQVFDSQGNPILNFGRHGTDAGQFSPATFQPLLEPLSETGRGRRARSQGRTAAVARSRRAKVDPTSQ